MAREYQRGRARGRRGPGTSPNDSPRVLGTRKSPCPGNAAVATTRRTLPETCETGVAVAEPTSRGRWPSRTRRLLRSDPTPSCRWRSRRPALVRRGDVRATLLGASRAGRVLQGLHERYALAPAAIGGESRVTWSGHRTGLLEQEVTLDVCSHASVGGRREGGVAGEVGEPSSSSAPLRRVEKDGWRERVVEKCGLIGNAGAAVGLLARVRCAPAGR